MLVENFAPGALDRMGFTWEAHPELNPRMIIASVKGFGPGPYEECKVYENVAQCAGGAASTTGFDDGPPLVTGAQIGDSGTGMHLVAGHSGGALSARNDRPRPARRAARCRTACSTSAASSCAISSGSQHGPLEEYPQYPNGIFGDAVPRAGNASGGGQPGLGGAHQRRRTRTTTSTSSSSRRDGSRLMKLFGRPELITDPDYATPEARLPKLE